jgi:hypothetical protein
LLRARAGSSLQCARRIRGGVLRWSKWQHAALWLKLPQGERSAVRVMGGEATIVVFSTRLTVLGAHASAFIPRSSAAQLSVMLRLQHEEADRTSAMKLLSKKKTAPVSIAQRPPTVSSSSSETLAGGASSTASRNHATVEVTVFASARQRSDPLPMPSHAIVSC